MESKRTFNVPNFNDKSVWQSSTLNTGYSDKGKIPNITGSFPSAPGLNLQDGYTGAFSDNEKINVFGSGGSFYNIKKTVFDASKVSNLYSTGIEAIIPARCVIYFCIRY